MPLRSVCLLLALEPREIREKTVKTRTKFSATVLWEVLRVRWENPSLVIAAGSLLLSDRQAALWLALRNLLEGKAGHAATAG